MRTNVLLCVYDIENALISPAAGYPLAEPGFHLSDPSWADYPKSGIAVGESSIGADAVGITDGVFDIYAIIATPAA